MASKRRNMFYENKKQETCNLSSFCDLSEGLQDIQSQKDIQLRVQAPKQVIPNKKETTGIDGVDRAELELPGRTLEGEIGSCPSRPRDFHKTPEVYLLSARI
ncbi:hypothetical protein AAG570_001235 [Ranatra chinensis]|uniref:Uncharacterized protein n=1 Tax=Ranatra chinensis TaxID=642074 RepID=A0ABD0YBJ8_9HEMI